MRLFETTDGQLVERGPAPAPVELEVVWHGAMAGEGGKGILLDGRGYEQGNDADLADFSAD